MNYASAIASIQGNTVEHVERRLVLVWAEDRERRASGLPTLLALSEIRSECFLALSELIGEGTPTTPMEKAASAIARRRLLVEFNSRFTARLGDATFSRNRVRFSSPLWERAGYAERRDTVRHEIAHLVANQIKRGAGHGPVWVAVAAALGASTSRCHTVANADLRRSRKKYPARCGCRTYLLTSIRTKRILKGAKYRCNICKKTLELGER